MGLVSGNPVFTLYDTDWHGKAHQAQYPPAKAVFAGGDDGQRVRLVLKMRAIEWEFCLEDALD